MIKIIPGMSYYSNIWFIMIFVYLTTEIIKSFVVPSIQVKYRFKVYGSIINIDITIIKLIE